MKSAAVIIFDKFEEIEAVCPIDILRRAGIEVKILGISETLSIVGRSGIELKADELFYNNLEKSFDAVIVSGGPGTYNVIKDSKLLAFIKRHYESGVLVGAICAAPLVLKEAGVLDGKECTGHTSIMQILGKNAKEQNVEVDANVITSRGAGTALEFALTLVAKLCGDKTAEKLAESICLSK